MPVMMLTKASSAPRSFDGSYSMSTRSSSTASLFTYKLCKGTSQTLSRTSQIVGTYNCCSTCAGKPESGSKALKLHLEGEHLKHCPQILLRPKAIKKIPCDARLAEQEVDQIEPATKRGVK